MEEVIAMIDKHACTLSLICLLKLLLYMHNLQTFLGESIECV